MQPYDVTSKQHFLLTNTIYISTDELIIKTVLGSCVAVCLWDTDLNFGGVNHYLLPLWNGEGLKTPKYGNIAIKKLIDKMLELGCKRENLKAKVFGGAAVLSSITNESGFLNIGERNIDMAHTILAEEKIELVAQDTGGTNGRFLLFNTKTGIVHIKKIVK